MTLKRMAQEHAIDFLLYYHTLKAYRRAMRSIKLANSAGCHSCKISLCDDMAQAKTVFWMKVTSRVINKLRANGFSALDCEHASIRVFLY